MLLSAPAGRNYCNILGKLNDLNLIFSKSILATTGNEIIATSCDWYICYWPSVRSRSWRWLDIDQVLSWRFYGPRRTHKKRMRPIFNHFDRNCLVKKGFLIWLSGKFFSRDTAGSHERARWRHLARSGNQSQRAIWFILPAHGANHIIKWNITTADNIKYSDTHSYTNLTLTIICTK